MVRALGSNILSIIGSRLLLCVLCVQVAFALAMAMAIFAGDFGFLDSAVAESVAGSAAVGLILVAVCAAARGIRSQGRLLARGRVMSDLMQTILNATQDWLWQLMAARHFEANSHRNELVRSLD